ncbi:hypothetical protein ACLB2K_006899 [Fragaria x ananassa]
MVEDMLKLGKMKNCLAVCDMSGSMSGKPMEVCVALGLLVSKLCNEPWKGKVAVNGKLKPENMIKRIFVFSDMEFDQASTNRWEIDYEMLTEGGTGSSGRSRMVVSGGGGVAICVWVRRREPRLVVSAIGGEGERVG